MCGIQGTPSVDIDSVVDHMLQYYSDRVAVCMFSLRLRDSGLS